ncbi:MAG: phosphoribosylglycinamide formyltransferase [Eubacteriales bacterium]|nr:phosphoribosylglycinamide formyltransferase [Eubacteriales bacterium]
MLKIAVCVSGGGTNLQAIIDAIAEGRIVSTQIVRVISNNADAYALTRAENAGIAHSCVSPKDFEDREAFNKAFLAELIDADPDLIVLAGFMVAVPSIVVSHFHHRIINIHPALIPSFCGKGYYGLHVHERALERGVKVTGATVHFVDEDLDHGPILLQKAVEIREGDTPRILQRRVMEQAEWVILPEAISLIAQGRVTIDENLITHIN